MDKNEELVRLMLEVCLSDNNIDSFTSEQIEMMKNWQFNL
jgi:hypothetical protein